MASSQRALRGATAPPAGVCREDEVGDSGLYKAKQSSESGSLLIPAPHAVQPQAILCHLHQPAAGPSHVPHPPPRKRQIKRASCPKRAASMKEGPAAGTPRRSIGVRLARLRGRAICGIPPGKLIARPPAGVRCGGWRHPPPSRAAGGPAILSNHVSAMEAGNGPTAMPIAVVKSASHMPAGQRGRIGLCAGPLAGPWKGGGSCPEQCLTGPTGAAIVTIRSKGPAGPAAQLGQKGTGDAGVVFPRARHPP